MSVGIKGKEILKESNYDVFREAFIVGGFGGILIFFVSFTLIFQYALLSHRRDEQIQNLAQNYLAKRK